MGIQTAEQVDHLLGVFRGIIFSFDERPFHEDPSSGAPGVRAAGIHELVERPATGDGDDPFPLLLSGGVEAQGEVEGLGLFREAKNAGRIAMPVLFLHAAWDPNCDTVKSTLAEPMRQHCPDLEEVVLACGHWMAEEKPVEVNAALAKWLAAKFPALWPA